jgi:protein translocase SecG subunit
VKALFNYITIVSAIMVIASVLLQARSASLGAGFGGETAFFHTKRGAEKVLYYTTIGSAIIFVTAVILGTLSK